MRKILFVLLLFLPLFQAIAQPVLKVNNYNYTPRMDESSDGIWQRFDIDAGGEDSVYRKPDSIFVSAVSWPNYGDLVVPDLELKIKTLWHNDSIFFLFQRLDDIYVSGINPDLTPDETVAEGIENCDATTIYIYFRCDSLRMDTDTVLNYSDSVAWLRFAWKSDKVEGQVFSGDTISRYEDFHASAVQWCEDVYCYTKLGINLNEFVAGLSDTLQLYIDSIGVGYLGFAAELSENDKEVGNPPFSLQTKAYWYRDMGETPLDDVPKWGWLQFFHDTLSYYATNVPFATVQYAKVYPNPATDYLNIRINEGYRCSYTLSDIMGRTMRTGYLESGENTLYVDDLLPGLYFIVLNDRKNALLTRKILISR